MLVYQMILWLWTMKLLFNTCNVWQRCPDLDNWIIVRYLFGPKLFICSSTTSGSHVTLYRGRAFMNLDTSKCWPAGLPSIFAIAEMEVLNVFMELYFLPFLYSFRRNSKSKFTDGWNGLIFPLTQNNNHLSICGLYCCFVASCHDPCKNFATSDERPWLSNDFLIAPSLWVSTL